MDRREIATVSCRLTTVTTVTGTSDSQQPHESAIILFVTLVFARLLELVITFIRPFCDMINTINMTLAQVVS